MAQDEEYNLGKRRSAFERIIETFNGGRRVRRQKQKNEVGDIPENSILRSSKTSSLSPTTPTSLEMEAPRKSVRISTRVSTIEIPSWDDDDDDEPEVCSSNDNSLDDVLEQKDLEDEQQLMYGINNEEQEESSEEKILRKSNSKIKSIFECIDGWNLADISKSFTGLSPIDQAILDASWKGELNLLEEALTNVNPNQMKIKINCKDNEGRTPLILASAFGNSQVVQFLIQRGAEINTWDKNHKATALVCAAACGNSSVLSILLANGATVNSPDLTNKTPLFWAVQSGSVTCVRKLLEAGANSNINLENWGSPLHVATSLPDEDVLPIMEILLEFQANPHLPKPSTLHTPLHLATKEGNADCMELLLRNGSPRDAADIFGMTPLHIAARNCDIDAIEVLIAFKANPNVHDAEGRTPLHRVISKDSRAGECLIFLLENGSEIDPQDILGYTPLIYAVLNDCAQMAGILLKRGSDITKRTKTGKDCLNLIVRRMPHVIRYIKESLDNAVTIQKYDPNDPQCVLKLDFRPIITSSHGNRDQSIRIKTDNPNQDNLHRETEFIASLIKTGHKPLLSHPLIEAFIVLKWEKVRPFFLASLAFHTFLVVLYTVFVLGVYSYLCPYKLQPPARNSNGTNSSSSEVKCMSDLETLSGSDYGFDSGVYCDLRNIWYIQALWFCLTFTTIFISLKELFQLVQEFRMYIKSIENWAQWCLLLTIYLAIWPLPMGTVCLQYWHYPSAAIGIFAAWSLMLVRIGRFPMLGIYVQMLGKVIRNFGLFILAYVCLLLAFALAFCILFPGEPTFKDPLRAFITVLVMLVGELNYDHLFYEDVHDSQTMTSVPKKLYYPLTDQIMFGVFVLLITVILMNLLVGLAVSDIQSLTEGAKMDRLARQTNSISKLESFLFSKGLNAFLPVSVGKFLRRSALLVPSSYSWTYYFRPHDPRDNRLPADLQQESLKLATSKQFRRKPSNNFMRRRAINKGSRSSTWASNSSLHPKEYDNNWLLKFEERIQSNMKSQMTIGFDRINQRIDELFLKLKIK